MKKVKLLSLFLSFALVLTSFSGFGAYAVGDTLGTAQSVEAARVREIEAYREVNSQTFLMSDGKYQCVVYAEDKFYESSDGKLVEIENAITTAKHTRGDVSYAYKNKSGKSDVYFANASGDIFISAEKGTLSFAPKAARSTAKTVLGTEYEHKSNDFALGGDNVIAYTDIYPNTDILYQVTNNGVKEYTVLKAKPETNAITYVFEHEGLKVSQGKKTVSFTNEKDDEVFSLGTLFALDNAGNYTENISYKLTSIDKYTTEITVAIDESYLAGAVYPIVIDPTVMITGQANTYDTFVSSANPNTNYYMNTYLRTGKDTPFGVRRTYIKFNLPASLNGVTVDVARMNIRMQSGVAPTRVFVYPAANNWTSSTLTWNNAPSYFTSFSTNLSLYQNNWYRANYLKDLVQDWIDGTSQNRGLVLFDSNESDTSHWTTFYSSEAASPNKPELVVEYSTEAPEPEPEPDEPIDPIHAVLMGVHDPDIENHNHYDPIYNAESLLISQGHTADAYYSSNFTKVQVLNYLNNNSNQMFVFRGHGSNDGSGTYICLNETKTIKLHSTDLTSAYDLSNMKIVMYIGCKTGYGNSNLPSISVARGAKLAIGFTDTIYCGTSNRWLSNMLSLLTYGMTVEESLAMLNESSYLNMGGNFRKVYGDDTVKIN